MTISDWIALSSAIATFVGVTVALVAIIAQFAVIKQQLKLQNFAEFTRRYQEIILPIPEVFREDAVLKDEPGQVQILHQLRSYFYLCYEEHILFRQGLIDSKVWRIWKNGMRAAFARPLIHQAWVIVSHQSCFDRQFLSFIEAEVLLEENRS